MDDVRALRALAAELRSGLPIEVALQAAAGSDAPAGSGVIRQGMLAAVEADRRSGDPVAALAAAGTVTATALAAAWAVCRRTGARLAPPALRIADAAAADVQLAREAEAALAPARASARLLAVLPFAGLALGALSGTGAMGVLLHTRVGQGCLVAGVALDLTGLAWLDRLARQRDR